MPGGGFEVEWLDGDPACDRRPDRQRAARWSRRRGWVLVCALAMLAAAAVPVADLHHHTGWHPRPSPTAIGFAPLLSCESLVGSTRWHDTLTGPGCTLDGKTIAHFAVTSCKTGGQLWTLREPGTGYWALTGILLHALGTDPELDTAYSLARDQCSQTDPTQRVGLGTTALVETFDGDLQVTLSAQASSQRPPATAGPVAITVRITCVYGKAEIDSFSLGAHARGTPSEVADPAQVTDPVLWLRAGQTVTGRAVFSSIAGRSPTVFWWGDDLNRPLVYWS